MATKKKVTKKVVSKPVAKSSPKAVKTIKSTKTRKTSAKLESFKLAQEKLPFTSIKVTEQTLYWSILFIYIFALSLWVLSIQLNILNIIETISASI